MQKKKKSELDEMKKIKKVNSDKQISNWNFTQDCWNKIEILFLELNKCKYVLLIYAFLF